MHSSLEFAFILSLQMSFVYVILPFSSSSSRNQRSPEIQFNCNLKLKIVIIFMCYLVVLWLFVCQLWATDGWTASAHAKDTKYGWIFSVPFDLASALVNHYVNRKINLILIWRDVALHASIVYADLNDPKIYICGIHRTPSCLYNVCLCWHNWIERKM